MLVPLKLQPGLYQNGTLYQAKGRWAEASLVRFFEQTIRPVGGWQTFAADGQTDDVIYSDAFTDTNGTALNSHVPDGSPTAFTWGAGPASMGTSAFTVESNAVSCTTDDATGTHQTSAQVVTPEYAVSLSVFIPTGATSDATLGLSARHASGGAGGYWALLRGDGSLVLTERGADGSITQTGTASAPTGFAQNASYTLTLRCEGSMITASYTATGTATASLTSTTWSGRYAGVWGSPKRTGLTAMSGDSFAVTLLGTVNVDGVPRAILGWRGSDGNQTVAIGTNTKLYAHLTGSLYDITPDGFTTGTVDAAYGAGGYGDGIYGSGPYGLSDPAQTTFEPPATWHFDVFGEYLVGCCSPNDGKLYYWERSPNTIAVEMTNAPTQCTGIVVTPEKFVVALGAGGESRRVEWASQATLDTWTPTSTNTAGGKDLEGVGILVAGRSAKGETLLWTTDDMHAMRYIGGTLVYGFEQIGRKCGLRAPGAVAMVDDKAFWMGNGQFFVYDGFVQPIPCDVSDAVFSDFNANQAGKVTCHTYSRFGEIWWYYPSANSSENDKYVVFNYRERHWNAGDLPRTAGCDAGAMEFPLLGAPNGKLYEHERSFAHTSLTGTELTPYLKSGPVEIGEGDEILAVSQIIPDERTLGDVVAYLYSSMEPMADERLRGPFVANKNTDARFSGRWVRLFLEQGEEVDWRVGFYRLEGTLAGRRGSPR